MPVSARDTGRHLIDPDARFAYLRAQGWPVLEICRLFVAEEGRADARPHVTVADIRRLIARTRGIVVNNQAVLPRYVARLRQARTREDLEALRDDLLTILRNVT